MTLYFGRGKEPTSGEESPFVATRPRRRRRRARGEDYSVREVDQGYLCVPRRVQSDRSPVAPWICKGVFPPRSRPGSADIGRVQLWETFFDKCLGMSSKKGGGACSIHKIRELQLPEVEIEGEYDVLREIGAGDYGRVLLATHRTTGSQVALKQVPKSSTPLRDFLVEFHYSYFLSPHNNILDTYDVAFETQDHYVFAQEVGPHGDVWQVIERTGGMEESDLKTVVKQVASALEFMHSKGLVHRDMRAENMLVFSEDFQRVKLTDFGLTRRADTLVKKRTRSLPTCPPEIWEAVHLEGYNVEVGSDVWQMGMFIFAGLLARFPWEKADITDPRFSDFVHWQKRKSTRTPKDFRKFTPRLHRLLRRLMDPKPDKRYQIKEVYKYLGDKWLICRSPRATATVSRADVEAAARQVTEQHLGDALAHLQVTEQKCTDLRMAVFDSDFRKTLITWTHGSWLKCTKVKAGKEMRMQNEHHTKDNYFEDL
ncbi:hypothetical protein JTE90_017197 [Oedothorax gibbosus]|uniref:Protein kinase domain-containing protein n=1 Tax=Oedothorax gibbosus TaxID=931172 RepID=A0AAV6V9M9_9ARAC|nr:hypothetical protein JTE90_017197 [Oedothorax gibbosus]